MTITAQKEEATVQDENLGRLMTKKEIMQYLHFTSESTWWNYVHREKLPIIKIGNRSYAYSEDIRKWLLNKKMQTAKELWV